MTKKKTYVGPCATACKPGVGTDAQNGTFDRILVAAGKHAAREAGLPGRADRMITCRSCGAPTASSDGICRGGAALMTERRMDLDVPGEEYYRHCPSRIAGVCGQLPEDWTPADKELWIDGCGRRDYCAAARAVVWRRR